MRLSQKKIIHVAVGVIENAEGEILIARRAAHQHQGNLWEFPGGKVEAGELVHAALVRELKEELDIEIINSEPLIQIRHHYADKSVFLDVRHVKSFKGVPRGNEGQPIKWVQKTRLGMFDFPEANKNIVSAIQLPTEMLITGEAQSAGDFCKKLERVLRAAESLPGAVLLRPSQAVNRLTEVWRDVVNVCDEFGVPILLNSSWLDWQKYIDRDEICGVHLTSSEIVRMTQLPSWRKWVGASCHNLAELELAQALGVNYALLSPIKVTRSHVDRLPLSNADVAKIIEASNIPIYGLGGLNREDLNGLKDLGMQGYAAISAFAW